MKLNAPTILAVVGFCTLALGLLCSNFIFPKLGQYLIDKETALQEGNKAFESWKKIPFPFKFKIYFFNVTNADDVQTGSSPIFKEIGPYIYDEFREREILSINEENDTIRYTQRKTYFFNEEESGCRSDTDIVTIINTAVVGIANKINKIAPMALTMINDALPFLYPGIQNIFTTDSVRNILFDGLKISCDSEETEMICDSLSSKRPHTIRMADNNRDYLVSLFHHLNGTEDGPYEIGRGFKNTVKGKVVSFKENSMLEQWGGDSCNTIKGTDLTVNPNLGDPPKDVEFFASDFCRSFVASFDKEMDHLGLRTYTFKSENLFVNKENCFCGKESADHEELPLCTPAGTMDITPCTGSSVVISQPHFLNAEKSLLKFARGLTPNKNKHGTFIAMEPKTGLALIVKSRFQMNIFLQRYEAVDLLSNVSEGVFPFIWLEEGAEVPAEIIEEIRNNFSKLKIFDVLKYILIVVGIILMGFSVILAMIKDKVFCFITNKNSVSVNKNDQLGKFDVYSHLKMNNASLVNPWENNVARHGWKISE